MARPRRFWGFGSPVWSGGGLSLAEVHSGVPTAPMRRPPSFPLLSGAPSVGSPPVLRRLRKHCQKSAMQRREEATALTRSGRAVAVSVGWACSFCSTRSLEKGPAPGWRGTAASAPGLGVAHSCSFLPSLGSVLVDVCAPLPWPPVCGRPARSCARVGLRCVRFACL